MHRSYGDQKKKDAGNTLQIWQHKLSGIINVLIFGIILLAFVQFI